MKPDLGGSQKQPGSSRAGAIPAKAPPPHVIHVHLAKRLHGRAWLARLGKDSTSLVLGPLCVDRKQSLVLIVFTCTHTYITLHLGNICMHVE